VRAEGGVPEQVLILPGLSPMIGSTEAEAQRMRARSTNSPMSGRAQAVVQPVRRP